MTATARQRVAAAMRGEVLDRPAFAVWRHFYAEEQPGQAQRLARRLVNFTEAHDLDLLKYNPRAHYHAEPWGTRYRYGGDEHPEVERYAVVDSAGWRDVQPVPPEGGVFDEMLEGLELARKALPDVPLVMTIFTPLAICERLAGRERLVADLRARPTDVLGILDAVSAAPFNVVHVCGAEARVLELSDYPVAAVSWNVHARGNPSPSVFLA